MATRPHVPTIGRWQSTRQHNEQFTLCQQECDAALETQASSALLNGASPRNGDPGSRRGGENKSRRSIVVVARLDPRHDSPDGAHGYWPIRLDRPGHLAVSLSRMSAEDHQHPDGAMPPRNGVRVSEGDLNEAASAADATRA